MFDLIFNKDDSFFLKKKIVFTRGAPQENDAKFRFAIHPKRIRQFQDYCQIAKCQTVSHWRQSTAFYVNKHLFIYDASPDW